MAQLFSLGHKLDLLIMGILDYAAYFTGVSFAIIGLKDRKLRARNWPKMFYFGGAIVILESLTFLLR